MTKIPQRDGKQTAQSILAIFITRSSSFKFEEGLDFTNNMSVCDPVSWKWHVLWEISQHSEYVYFDSFTWKSYAILNGKVYFICPSIFNPLKHHNHFYVYVQENLKHQGYSSDWGHRGYVFSNILYIPQNTSTPKRWFNPAFVQTFMIPRGWIQMTLLMADFSSSATMRLWCRV